MLKIYTDLSDHNWLTYILEEFSRISNASFPIKVLKLEDASNDDGHAVFYTSESQGRESIPNRSSKDYGELIQLSDDLYVYENTRADDSDFLLPYDLLYNAFLILSRKEEFDSEAGGNPIRSYSSRHPRKDKSIFDIPLVNIYFKILEEIICKLFPDLEFKQEENFRIELSHDIDYLKKTPQLLIKQTAFNLYNVLRSLAKPGKCLRNLKKTCGFLLSGYTYNCFDYWKKLELDRAYPSVFYVFVKRKGYGLKRWLIDPSYNISKNPKLQKQLIELAGNGFEIGLHGSLGSAMDKDILSEEKEQLEKVLGQTVTRVRQHWLNYSEMKTPEIHNTLFELDSTLGWNDRMGFRSGCASKFRPWDHVNNKVFDYFVVPQVLMDSNIFDYADADVAKTKAIDMLKDLKEFKNVNAAISWHYRTCSKDYGWHHIYEEIIDECI